MREREAPDGKEPPEYTAVTFKPSAELPQLTEHELEVLGEVGRQWARAHRRVPRSDGLPLDPGLGRQRPAPQLGRFSRLAPIGMFRSQAPEELVATGEQLPAPGRLRAQSRIRRVLLGPRLRGSAVVRERMRKLVGLPVLSSDLLSSVAYGPETMLSVLVLAGSGALRLSLPIAGVLVVLMITVGVSYRQTIRAYPRSAGSYLVASENLGDRFGLAAAAGLMMDYILTVAVSVAAGVNAITSALPWLAPVAIPMGIAVIAVLLAGNLRGVRAAGRLFAAPTYAFIFGILLLLGFGAVQAARRGFAPLPPPNAAATQAVGVMLVLRAFASGASSMTGVEAVSDAVPVFRPPEWRNARTTLTWMVSLLVVMFTGLVMLMYLQGVAPRPNQTVLSELGRKTFPVGPLYDYLQASTALILLLAANTAFQDFPRLLFFMAHDRYAPRSFLRLGDRLVFSNGILTLSVGAALLFIVFHGRTRALIPLYAVGVFLAFTLSQTGMVRHWSRVRGPHWRRSLVINAAGAVLSAIVLVTAAVGKFTAGAWVVVAGVLLVVLIALGIRRHYDAVWAATTPRAAWGSTDRPQEIRHLTVVPVARLDLSSLCALAYAASLGQPLFAVHISPDDEEDERFRRQWSSWGDHVRLEIIVSPSRAVVASLASYLEALHLLRPDITLTVVLPELAISRWWVRPLHGHMPARLRRALRGLPGVVITSVPLHVP
ncbi:APC family permease [Rugosimonospora acidiphila]|uniref:APC family permease n=1 Tax=Rugosimonospora acidiphila TaxID=556531 RepID=A0ABP9RPN5_9ACTN